MTGRDDGVCRGCSTSKDDVMPRMVGSTSPQLCAECADARRAIVSDGQQLASKPPRRTKFSDGGEV